jgi:hypothetical protein
VLLEGWRPTPAEPQKTLGPVPIAGGATFIVDVEPGALHPTEPDGIHVLCWLTPSLTQAKDEAVYVVLRKRGQELLVKQRHEVLGRADVKGGRPLQITTAISADGRVSVTVGVAGLPGAVAIGKKQDTSRPLYVWLSSLNAAQTPGPEVPSLGWAHRVEVR